MLAIALLADTVGFVRDLPHELVAAFRSTLQEAREATLLLHVIDAADPNRSERIAQVNQRARAKSVPASCRRSRCSTRSISSAKPPHVETRRAGRRAARLAVRADRGRARSC